MRAEMDGLAVELLQQNAWANERILEACRALTAQQLELSIPGTYGKIQDVLTHLLAAEQRYIRALSGEARPDMLSERNGFPGIDVLFDHARWSGPRLIALARAIAPGETFDQSYQGKRFRSVKSVVLVQAVEHGTEHRAHSTVTMSFHGIQPPPLDGWTYGDHRGQIVELGQS